jgi:hypothetical protein
LSGSSYASEGGRPDDHVQVGILIDDESVVAAELELNKKILKLKLQIGRLSKRKS